MKLEQWQDNRNFQQNEDLPNGADRDADKVDRVEEAEILTRHSLDLIAIKRWIAMLNGLPNISRLAQMMATRMSTRWKRM